MGVKTIVFGALLSFAAVAETETLVTSKAPSRVGNCQVRIWSAHDVTGGRCTFFDEVMVGIRTVDPLVIRCGRLEVTCSRPSRNAGREVQP